MVYSAGSTGNVAPIRTITGNDTDLDSPQGVALDSSGNLYTESFVNGVGYGVNAYAAGANGDVSPLTSIIGADTGIAGPNGIVVDAGGRLYVSNSGGGPTGGGSVTIYAAGSTGDAVPATTITSSFTGLPSASRIAVDSTGNIYVANESAAAVSKSIPPAAMPPVRLAPRSRETTRDSIIPWELQWIPLAISLY